MKNRGANQDWEKLLTPEILQANLLMASLYLSAFEILKSTAIDRIKDFFSFDNVSGQPQLNSKYQQVTSLNSSPLQASLLWLEQNDALTADDVQMIAEIRRHRNDLAHKLPHFLMDTDHNINIQHFENIRYLLRKIEIWWIRQLDIPANPDYDGVEIKDEDIEPGSVLMLDAIIGIALKGV